MKIFHVPSQYAMPHLRNNSGNIINNASIAAHIGQQGAVDYVSTKVSSSLDLESKT